MSSLSEVLCTAAQHLGTGTGNNAESPAAGSLGMHEPCCNEVTLWSDVSLEIMIALYSLINYS